MQRWVGKLLLIAGSCICGLALAAIAPLADAHAAVAVNVSEPISLNGQPQALVARGSATIRDAAAGRLASPLVAVDGSLVALGKGNELWIELWLHNPTDRPLSRQLQFALPSIDEVTFFEQRGTSWTEASAGDHTAMGSWPVPGRFPRLGIRFESGEKHHIFLRVRNTFPAPIPLRLVDAQGAEAVEQQMNLIFGAVLGALALLGVACLVQAAIYRDTAYFLYAAYVLLLALGFAALSGLAALHVWGDSLPWTDVSKSTFPLASAGVSVWLVRALCSVPKRGQWASRVSAAIGALVIASAIAIGLYGTSVPWLSALAVFLAAGSVVTMAVSTWRRGDPMGGWVLAAHVPIIAVTLLVILRMYGLAPVDFDGSIAVSVAIGVILPLLLAALQLRSKEFLTLKMRVRELPSVDPLTGLLSPKLFSDRVAAAVGRYRRSRHNAVVVYVRVANYRRIVELHGNSVAEQTMIRAAMKLQRLIPGADCLGRVGESTMGMILETVTARGAVMERASRLVAHGLMPLKGLKPEVILNFHVVANSLDENPLEGGAMQAGLESVLASMSLRTRRPIRFLDSNATRLGSTEYGAEEEDEPDALQA